MPTNDPQNPSAPYRFTGYSLGAWMGRDFSKSGYGRISWVDLRTAALEAGRADLVGTLDRLADRGSSYSNEDFDIMGAAWAALGWPRSIVKAD